MAAEKMFSPREASKVLGISYATLKLWIYKGKIRTIKTAGGHHRIPESQLDKFLHGASDKGEVATKRTGFRNISGRNQLIGRVTDIKISGLSLHVTTTGELNSKLLGMIFVMKFQAAASTEVPMVSRP